MATPKGGGFKMSLGGLKAKPGLKAAALQKETKKPRLTLGEDEPEETNKHEEILGWDAAEGGAVSSTSKPETQGPRIIPVRPNRDLLAEARRRQLSKAPHQQAEKDENAIREEEPKAQYGLHFHKREMPKDDEAPTEVKADAMGEPMEIEKDDLTEEQRLEKKALDALISGKSHDDEKIIPMRTEQEALQHDLENAPDAPTLAAYEATPIEGFGAALLRGMGWKDGESIGKHGVAPKTINIKRRPALLSLGAKDSKAAGLELGGPTTYKLEAPLTMLNKKTGERLTEEELKKRLENQEMISDRTDDDEDKRERRKGKEERNRDKDYDRERRRDKDPKGGSRRNDREREDDYGYDRERRREKERDRDRDRSDDYDSERRSDKRRERSGRERSRSPRDKDRDRYRSRSRESKKHRDRRRDDRSRSRDSEDRRKRRRDRDYDYDYDREDRKRRHKDYR